MCVIVGFSDESATGDALGPFLQAGYLAPKTSWPFVENAWNERILRRDPRIDYLHMVEIRDGDWQAQHGLSRLQAEDKIEFAWRQRRFVDKGTRDWNYHRFLRGVTARSTAPRAPRAPNCRWLSA